VPGSGQIVTLPVLLTTFREFLPSKYQLPSTSRSSGFSPGETMAAEVVGCVAGLVEGAVAGKSSLKSGGGGTSSAADSIFSVFSSSARQSRVPRAQAPPAFMTGQPSAVQPT